MKKFNTAGFCNPEKNYMVNPLRGLEDIIYKLVGDEQYFLLHAPRQMGKTTLLREMVRWINAKGEFIACMTTVESGGVPNMTLETATEFMMSSLYQNSIYFLPEQYRPLPPRESQSRNMKDYLTEWASAQEKPIVLLIDEVDALMDDVLVSFLRQMRDGFLVRPKQFPASLALVGLRDIRDYKLKVRAGSASLGSGSPFNIKTESFLLINFTFEEVTTLLRQHSEEQGQAFSDEVCAKIFELSAGQPWLTNAIAYDIVERQLQGNYALPITLAHVEQAKENLIARRDTHLDSLLDKLQEERVRPIIGSIITGDEIFFDNYNDALLYCRDLGIIAPNDPVRFANPIYKEIATRTMNSNFHSNFDPDIVETAWYLKPDGRLDMNKLLHAFIEFYRIHSESWLQRFQFKEAGHQLLIMAFLQRIVNGGGRIDREMAAGRGRTDVIVEWMDEKFVLELKLNHHPRSREAGLKQLDRYLDRLGKKEGYLIIFEKKKVEEISWEERLKWEEEVFNGKNITVIEM